MEITLGHKYRWHATTNYQCRSALTSRVNLHGVPCQKLSKSLGWQRQFGI